MTKWVFKYRIEGAELLAGQGMFAVDMPKGARVTLAGMQHGMLTLWAIVDPEAERETREFCLRGTGKPLPTNCEHVYSFMQNEGEFVWHLFELER